MAPLDATPEPPATISRARSWRYRWIAIRLGAMGATTGAYLRGYAFLTVFMIAGILFLVALRRWADREETAIRELAATLDAP